MTPQTKKGLIVVAIFIAAFTGYFVYKSVKNKPTSKAGYIANIIANGLSAPLSTGESISSFDEPYLKAWSDAVFAKTPTFTYLSKQYKTIGGKAV